MYRTKLTDKDIRIGVWTYGDVDTENFVPNSCNRIPENIPEFESLFIHVGAWTGLPDKEHKKERKEWIKLLPNLKKVKFLWVKGSINQEFFDTICQMPWLQSLNLSGLISIKNIENITSLNNLLHLFVGTAGRVENIDAIAGLEKIITLQIEGFKKINDITPITKLATLKGLHIQGDMWKKQYIDSIKGIDNLKNLEYLSLDGTEVKNKVITPIRTLKKLKNLEVGYWWTKEDLQLLYKSLPLLEYGSIKEAVESGDYEKYLKKIK